MVTMFHVKNIWRLSMVIVVFGLCPAHDLAAEAVGSPASILKKGQWAMGLGGGALLGRGLKGDAEATVYQGGHFRGYGLTDGLSLYGKIGGAYLEVDDASIKKTNDPSSTNSFGAAMLVNVQLKGRIWEHAKTGWEWDGSIHYVDIRARHRDDNDGRWHEWVFATSVAKAFGRVKPYVGIKLSIIDFDFKIRQNGSLLQQGDYKQDGLVGAFLGTDVSFGESEDVILNIETSYTDGAEITASIAYTF